LGTSLAPDVGFSGIVDWAFSSSSPLAVITAQVGKNCAQSAECIPGEDIPARGDLMVSR
jgi:hypothetical protein